MKVHSLAPNRTADIFEKDSRLGDRDVRLYLSLLRVGCAMILLISFLDSLQTTNPFTA
jgi:hypothetical protein